MTTLSSLGFATTLGISVQKIPKPRLHEKIEKKVWTGIDAERFALHATADTETKFSLVPLIVVELDVDQDYLCAMKQNTTGNYIIRRFTKNPQKNALARHGYYTSFSRSHLSEWCVDIDDHYTVPDWFWATLQSIVSP